MGAESGCIGAVAGAWVVRGRAGGAIPIISLTKTALPFPRSAFDAGRAEEAAGGGGGAGERRRGAAVTSQR